MEHILPQLLTCCQVMHQEPPKHAEHGQAGTGLYQNQFQNTREREVQQPPHCLTELNELKQHTSRIN